VVIVGVLLCAVGAGIGAASVVRALEAGGRPSHPAAPGRSKPATVASGGIVVVFGHSFGAGTVRRLVLAVVVGTLAYLLTGWIAAVPIAAGAALGLPVLYGRTAASTSVGKIEAIAAWTEMLQSTLAASAGLNQAIVVTAPLAPLPIRPAAQGLAGRLESGTPTKDALLVFADDLNDASADRVVCALVLAAASRAQRLGDLLSALADSTRDEVALRLRVETSRAWGGGGGGGRLGCWGGFAGGLALLARSYLAPFGSPVGQVVLVAIGLLYAGGLSLMVTMSRPPEPVRLLGSGVHS
jgi:hypothetical protein